MKNGPRLSSALAPHRILTQVPAMDQYRLMFELFEAIRPDFAHCLDVWEEARKLTVQYERALPGYFGNGLGILQPIGNAGAPGSDWLAASASSPEGIRFEHPNCKPGLAHFVVLTLNPSQPRGAYLYRIRSLSFLSGHAVALGRAPDAGAVMKNLLSIEEVPGS